MAQKILVVDDDATLLDMVRFVLMREGFEVLDAEDAFKGLETIAREKVDLALLDVMMPKMDGLTMLAKLREHNQELKVIIMTAVSTPETAIAALREQACDFLAKPFDVPELLSAVKSAFDLGEQEIEIEVLSARPEWIELRVPCDLAAIEPLKRIMIQLETDLPQETRDSVTYAFSEMLRNAIEHGGKNDPTKDVEVAYLRTPRIVLYRIKDPGEGFSMEALYHAAILNPEGDPIHHERIREEKGMRPGGFGILIASNMVDEMVYNERHNEVVLIKYLDGAA
jgi:CheY-like chemotaxis protein/anti-sigma regulatory factor (Ser/Thr protein kinase)